jgi:hypothetical protein
MAVLDTPILSGCSRVEVSGWDEDELFFVEKSQLAGNDLTGRHISLQHKLAEGTIVFVRLLHSTAYQQPCPAAYQVEYIGSETGGSYEFRLHPAQPRHSNMRYPVN